MHLDLDSLNHLQVAVPTMIRLIAQPLIREVIAHCYHKAVHHVAAHTVAHRIHFVGHFLKKYPVAIDVVVVLAMLAYESLTEGHEAGEGVHEVHEVGSATE